MYKSNRVNFRQLWPTGLPLSLEAHVNFMFISWNTNITNVKNFMRQKHGNITGKWNWRRNFFVMYVLSTMELFFKKLIKSDLKVVLQNRMLLQSFPLSLYKCSHSSNTTSSKMCLKVTTYVLKQLHTNKKAPCWNSPKIIKWITGLTC